MATWKKVIVSGSSAALSSLTLDTDLAIAQGGTGASSAGAARTALGVDAAGTDNSTDISLAGSLNYITLSGQEITRNAIDLAADITGVLPSANLDADTAHLTTDQTFSGNKTFSANLIAQGDVDLGNATGDTITATGRFDSSLVPSTDSARDLGTTSLYWANAYVDSVTTTGNITAGGMISGSFISSSRDIHIKGMAVSASIATLSAASGEANIPAFKTIAVAGQDSVVADADDDTLTIAAGAGLAITTTAGSDTITFANDGVLQDLDTIGAAGSDGQFIVATGAGAFAYESADTARTSLGLGTGNSPTFDDLTVSGDLTVNGSQVLLNTTNLTVEDRFVFIATGSAASNVDAGIVVQSGSAVDQGSAIYHDITSQRWSVAKGIAADATSVAPLSFVTTVTTAATSPNTASGSYGVGEMWVETDTQEVYIRTA